MDKLNEDMYAVLMDKTEGDAWLRVRSVDSGNGLEAFVKVYKWCTGTSGQGLSERARIIMSPTPPKSEGDIADCIDKWFELRRHLQNIKRGYALAEPSLFVALEQILEVGRSQEFFEQHRSTSTISRSRWTRARNMQ